MRLGSEWLRALTADESRHALPPLTCWYTNCDNVVIPATTAVLPAADQRFVAGQAHVALAFSPKCGKRSWSCWDAAEAPVKVNPSPRSHWRMSICRAGLSLSFAFNS
jgi:hypothetical protein